MNLDVVVVVSLISELLTLHTVVFFFQLICIKCSWSLKSKILNQSSVKSLIKHLTSAGQVANFLFSTLLTSMEIKWFNLVALLDFPNIIKRNRSNPESKMSLYGLYVTDHGNCSTIVWPLWKLASKPVKLLEGLTFSERHTKKVNTEARNFLWYMCQASSSIWINRRHFGIQYLVTIHQCHFWTTANMLILICYHG